MNSADTFVTVSDMESGKYVNFVSESGSLELFLFASSTAGKSNRFKKVQHSLALVSGFIPLPLFHMLGFNFCKWAGVSADILMQRNENFSKNNFPVDVLWSDIEWAQQNS